MYKFVIAYHIEDSISGFLGVDEPVENIDDQEIRVFDTHEEAEALGEPFVKILRVHVSNLDVSLRYDEQSE